MKSGGSKWVEFALWFSYNNEGLLLTRLPSLVLKSQWQNCVRKPSHDNVALVDNNKIWPAHAEGGRICILLPTVPSNPKKERKRGKKTKKDKEERKKRRRDMKEKNIGFPFGLRFHLQSNAKPAREWLWGAWGGGGGGGEVEAKVSTLLSDFRLWACFAREIRLWAWF